jgi:hypothetical protein
LSRKHASDEKIMLTQNLTRINVPLARDEAQMIIELARKEFRHPREQARLLIYEALCARGIVDDATKERIHNPPPPTAGGERR